VRAEPSRAYAQRIFVPATACAASSCAFALWRVCGLGYPFTMARVRALGAAPLVSTPPFGRSAWLGIASCEVPPNLSSISGFPKSTQSLKSVASTVPPRRT
jgi:hypothetical protein